MTASREYILAEIQRVAAENPGGAVGRRRFRAATGIRDGDWLRYWARWGDAVAAAGIAPSTWQRRLGDDEIMAPLVAEIRRLGRMPTYAELALLRREGAPLPSEKVYGRRYGSKRSLVEGAIEYCRARPEFGDVRMLLEPLLGEAAPRADEVAEDRAEAEALGHVYLIKASRYYKLGRTNSLERRKRELAVQLPERALVVHTISTDDPPGIEAYWHRRFADRRANGEWFSLASSDVRAFERRKFM